MSIGKRKFVEVYRQSKTLLAAAQTNVDIPSDNMPGGIIHGLHVRIEADDLTGLGAASADFQKVLNGMTLGMQNPNHRVFTAFPGKTWDALWTMWMGRAMPRTTPTAAGFAISFYFPFSYQGTAAKPAYRPKDTACLNINNKALPFASLLLGPKTDVGTTITADPPITVIVEADYEPVVRPGADNAVDPRASGDQPIRLLSVSLLQKADLPNPVFNLNTGGLRENIALAFIQKNSATNAVVSDIFNVLTATPSKFEIIVGDSDGYTPRRKVKAHDADMDRQLRASITAGYHLWFAASEGKMTDNVDLRSGPKFRAEFDNFSTTATRLLECVQIDSIDLTEAQLNQHAAWLGVAAAK
jgi:hypothetical protein